MDKQIKKLYEQFRANSGATMATTGTIEKMGDTNYTYHSASGSTYNITARPIPDEFDSASDFVAQIPLVWSCDCPAGRANRDCKHLDHFMFEVCGRPLPDRAAQRQAAKKLRAIAARADLERVRTAEAARMADQEAMQRHCRTNACILACRAMLMPGTWGEVGQLGGNMGHPRIVGDVAAFEAQFGFRVYDTRLASIARGRTISERFALPCCPMPPLAPALPKV